MLSVIVMPGDPDRVAGLLSALVEGVVESVVRDVTVVGEGELLEAVCEASGARLVATERAAIEGARGDWLLVLPPEIRFAEGWVERLADHLRDGVREARLQGVGGRWLRRAPEGLLVRRATASSVEGGLQRLAGKLGRGACRLR